MNDSDFLLPPYTYVPGKNPHPFSDPNGHSYQQTEHDNDTLETNLKRGLFLFQNHYYWEAHEAWEQAWIQLGRKGDSANFVKGFIKLAASGVKCLEENRSGAERHLKRAKELISNAPDNVFNEIEEWLPAPEKLIQKIDKKLASVKKENS